MSTIYLLTAGEYSDYHIVAAYSTRELAEKAQELCPDSGIEEYELDSKQIPEHPPGHTAWHTLINVFTNEILFSYQCDGINGFEVGESYTERNHTSIYEVNCWARDEEHARKIALDKYYQWKWERENKQ
jgi:hypothetical protein